MDGRQGNVTQGDMQTPNSYGQQQQQSYGQEPSFLLNEFQFDSEMGPVADISTFPPTMAPYPPEDNMGVLAVDNILSSGFWDSMLVPGTSSDQLCVFVRYANFPFLSGYNSMDCFSGGFVFGANGSGLITPRFGGSPSQSGINTPGRFGNHPTTLTQTGINAAFDQRKEGISIDA